MFTCFAMKRQQLKKRIRLSDGELKRRYRDPTRPGSLGGVARFAKAQGVSVKRAAAVLRHELAYTLHKPVRRRFPTSPVLVFGPYEQWAADLVDTQNTSKWNKGTKYLLCVIDVFSKFAWVEPLKTKKGVDVALALTKIFNSRLAAQYPTSLQTDAGKEFYNSTVQKLLKDNSIRHFSTSGDTKASVVERFIRIFKQRLYRYFTTFNTLTYLTSLPNLVKGYNASPHRSIGMAPKDVTFENTPKVWETLYGKKLRQKQQVPSLKVGDRVRLNKKNRPFKKGYLPGWTEEVFVITEARGGNVPTYKVSEWDDTPIRGTFYSEDLQKVEVRDDDLFRVERIVKTKGPNVLVRWKVWPPKYDSWIPKSSIRTLKR